MRKLKLQMQITVDGFVAGPEGQNAAVRYQLSAIRKSSHRR